MTDLSFDATQKELKAHSGITRIVAIDPWCNSERIEGSEPQAQTRHHSEDDATQKELKADGRGLARGVGRPMQLRKNWRLSRAYSYLSHLKPRCNSERIEGLRQAGGQGHIWQEMQLRKNWRSCSCKRLPSPWSLMQLRKNWRFYVLEIRVLDVDIDATQKELKAEKPCPSRWGSSRAKMQLRKNWRSPLSRGLVHRHYADATKKELKVRRTWHRTAKGNQAWCN